MDLKLYAAWRPARRNPGVQVTSRRAALAVALLTLISTRAEAETKVEFWHAMSGELGQQLERLVADFNRSQPDDRIVPVYKGNYTEVVSAAIFAVRTHTQPAVVQVNEIATATMMAARGAVYPVFELMRRQGIEFDRDAFLPAISGYYSDIDGNLLSFPFNSSTPILYYNKDLFRAAQLDDSQPPKTWPEVEAAARKLRQLGVPCGFTTHWPSWVNVENFSAFHNVPIATKVNGLAGLDAELTINNPVLIRHVAALAEWQKTNLFDYGGRAQNAEPRFPSGQCGIFLGSSGMRAYAMANSRFRVGFGMLPYWPDVAGAPQNSIIGGATLWVLRGRPEEEYKAVARFFAYLSQPQIQAAWHQSTGYLPVTQAAYQLTRAQGFYDRNPGTAIPIEEINHKPPTENSRGLRLGSFVLIRDAIEDELEQAFAGKKSAKAALDSAVARGNDLLRQFERATR
ncbi:MAG TPA: sn-glycerol-3-phosphate ABC transporter substrate-binding protein UgpB [Xanthobacteraceae bacterium]|nr:sn-glycerol-3-phosphate ABC transporter substrate-binding protein UgpB [Xanthobacteraceae bacterium]